MGNRFTKGKLGLRGWIASFFGPVRECKEVPTDTYAIQKYKEALSLEARDTGPYPDATAAVEKFQKKLKKAQKQNLKSENQATIVDIKSRKRNRK